MGEARQVMDRLTNAIMVTKDIKAAAECYATDAVAITPDAGEIRGNEAISEYMRQFIDAFPDLRYEYVGKYESGNTAVDEGVITGTHTGSLVAPTGETIPPTNQRIAVRGCDVVTVENGRVTQHRLYFDQVEFLGQLGLMPELPA